MSALAERKRAQFIEVLRECGSVKHAATMAGLRTNHLYEDRKANPELADAWDAALDEFAGKMHNEISLAALGKSTIYKADPRFLIEVNKAHNAELFQPKREHTTIVNVGQEVQTRISAPARPPIEVTARVVPPVQALPEPGS